MTADILIHVAANAYRDSPFAGPAFRVYAPSQPSWDELASFVVSRALSGAPSTQSRWGDGESGDSYGSMEEHGTQIGVDFDRQGAAVAEQEAHQRDLAMTLREAAFAWETQPANGAIEQLSA